MNTLVVVDPGMDLPVGHHLSTSSEIARSAREMGFDCSFVVSKACDPEDFRFLGCDVLPTFSIGPYVSDKRPERDLAQYLASERELRSEYEAISIPNGACVLMHTSSPWHLKALAERLKRARGIKVAIGLMLATSYWTNDPRMTDILRVMADEALSELSYHNCFVYSENGAFNETATLSLPVSAQTLSEIVEWETTRPPCPARKSLTMGYFGRPRPEKGFDSFLEAIGTGALDNRTDLALNFFLPAGYLEVSRQIAQLSPVVEASSMFREYGLYIKNMMSVDVVLCFYDPHFYGAQMSGIVSEAALLGKAVLTVKETSLHRFLNRYSPGSYCALEFTQDALVSALKQPSHVWREMQQKAMASMWVVRELKKAERFFGVAFGLRSDCL